jgi:hypothetical protein
VSDTDTLPASARLVPGAIAAHARSATLVRMAIAKASRARAGRNTATAIDISGPSLCGFRTPAAQHQAPCLKALRITSRMEKVQV